MEITKQDIIDAHERIKPFIHKTPVLTSQTINKLTGAEVFFKCENFQKIGAFKIRGGMNSVLSLPKEKQQNGIATHSSGNHAQAIALGSKRGWNKGLYRDAGNFTKVKVDAVRGYGAEIFFVSLLNRQEKNY
jgi:threonine dehydratase